MFTVIVECMNTGKAKTNAKIGNNGTLEGKLPQIRDKYDIV